jgi:hypothetical protein
LVSDIDWDDYVYHEPGDTAAVELDLTDYAALFIASMETIFLPLIVMGVLLFAMSVYFTLFF